MTFRRALHETLVGIAIGLALFDVIVVPLLALTRG